MLTKKDEKGNECSILFMRTNLQGEESNYPMMEKHTFSIHKSIKQFNPYILKNHTKVIVHHQIVRPLFFQKEIGEHKGNWMTIVQEYDLEFKTTTIVKVQGLCIGIFSNT